ncbi:hypothetical protein HMPREF1869_01242 [Bacteroidales bacterium KA00251]|nr:hypothetical protein HMPREF1869_01242 [Bacteroidales bacterium KA00251]
MNRLFLCVARLQAFLTAVSMRQRVVQMVNQAKYLIFAREKELCVLPRPKRRKAAPNKRMFNR